MSGVDLLQAAAALIEADVVAAEDVQRLRSHVFGDGVVSRDDAELLFKIKDSRADLDSDWERLFTQTLTDYIVHQEQPHGYVSGANAGWLIGQMRSEAAVRRWSDIAALVAVMEAAKSVPETLAAFTLARFQDAILSGGHIGREGDKGVIAGDDVAMIRRALYAFGGDGNTAITQTEAAFLFDLNDRTDQAANHQEWSDLFVKAIANFLMKANGYAVPSRQEALRREDWLNSKAGIGATIATMLSLNLKNIWAAYRADAPLSHLTRDPDRIAAAEKIDAAEAQWLADRIGRDATLHDNEKALLRFLAEESPSIHPALQTLIDTAA